MAELTYREAVAAGIAQEMRRDERVFVIFVVGTVVARSAGCVINDFADRRVDAHVRRTAERPLARGSVSAPEALVLFALLGVCALALVVLPKMCLSSSVISGQYTNRTVPLETVPSP